MSRLWTILQRQRGAAVGIALFTAGALLVTSLVAGTLIGSSGKTENYQAVFSSASGLKEGDDVRIAGVRVGNVESVELDGVHARVEFSLSTDQHLYAGTTATIEFLNLLGQRYIHLEGGTDGEVLDPGATIGLEQTHEGLDLTAVFNAFKPLFEMIKPEDVNQLATEIVQVLQGQGGRLQHLTEQTALLTRTLVDRDEVIGAVIDNLTVVMETMDGHRTEFRSMIRELDDLTGVIARNREQIGATVDAVQGLVTTFSSIVAAGRDSVVSDIDALAAWSESFAGVTPKIAQGLKDTTLLLSGYVMSLGQGSYLNTYVCESFMKIGAAPPANLSTSGQRSWRCK